MKKMILVAVLCFACTLISCMTRSEQEKIENNYKYLDIVTFEDYMKEITEKYGEVPTDVLMEYVDYKVGRDGMIEWYLKQYDIDEFVNTTNSLNEYVSKADMLSYLMDNYTLDEIIDYYASHDSWCLSDVKLLTDMGLICSEIEGQECYEEFGNLFGLAEKIGYNPSIIFGDFCFDTEERVIHYTNGECVENISYANMSFPYRGSKEQLEKMIVEGDNGLNGYLFCDLCFEK